MGLLKKIARSSLNLYFPHEGNNFKARILHPSGFFLIKVGLIALQLVMQFLIISPFPNILGYAANISVEEVIMLTNEKRAQEGLAPLKQNSTLSASAFEKGKHMLAQDYWAHVAPDGTEPWFFFKQGGYSYRYAGENLARDFSDANSAVEAWMASPSHRENILSTRYKDIGIAVVEGDLNGVDTTIIVQFLGTRLVDTLPLEPIAANSSTQSTLTFASPSPTSTPQPAVVAAANQPSKSQILISPFVTTKGMSLAVVVMLLIVLAIDAFITSRRRIRRVGGRVFAHIAFLGMILTIMLILKAGEIL